MFSFKIRTFSLKMQLILLIVFGVFLPILILIIFSGLKYKEITEESSKNKAYSVAGYYANDIEKNLNEVFSTINSISTTFESLIKLKKSNWLTINEIHKIQESVLLSSNSGISVYTILWPGMIDSASGSLNKNLILLGNDKINEKLQIYDDWNYSFKSNIEDTLKKGNGYMIIPPYTDSSIDSGKVLIISYGKAITINNQFAGLVGMDIKIQGIQELISKNELFNGKARISIISSTGIINGDSKSDTLLGKNVRDVIASYSQERSMINNPQEAGKLLDGKYIYYVPVNFNRLNKLWYIRLEIPEKVILEDAQKGRNIIIFIFSIIIFLILILSLYYFNKLTGRISKLASSARLIAEGNLNIEISTDGQDELTDLGNSLIEIVTRFSNIIDGIKIMLEQLQNSTEDLTKTSVKLYEGATEQASSTEQVSASMEQMSANIEQNTENAKFADSIAKKSSKEIQVSSKNVQNTASSMGEIARKINAINDIAFQINILALNAAVEAARAGIYGKGFGVVADEVGKLADRSKLAALEIDQLTARSYIVAKESGISLEKIAPEIQKTAVLVQDIVNASIEQNAGSDQINSAIQQLNNVTQQNASSAEQLASSVENLHLLAEKLNKLIAFFKIGKNEIEKSKEKKQIEKLEKYKEEMAVERGKKNKITIDKDAEISEEKINGPQNLSDKGYNLDLRNEKSFDDGFEKF